MLARLWPESRASQCVANQLNPASAPTHAALEALLAKIITRLLRLLTRLGHLVEEAGETYLAGSFIDPDDVMTPLQTAAANYRIAQGPRAGQKVLNLQLAPRRPVPDGESSALCANERRPAQVTAPKKPKPTPGSESWNPVGFETKEGRAC